MTRPEDVLVSIKGGVDIVELAIPFLDPMTDGPVIQSASEKALKNRINLHDVLHYVQEFRQKNLSTPIVLMGYANFIEQMKGG